MRQVEKTSVANDARKPIASILNAAEYLAAEGNTLVSNCRTQAAASLPIWMSALANGECPETKIAVDAGQPFARALTAEFGVSPWVWRRLRELSPAVMDHVRACQSSFRCMAKIIHALGPNVPTFPPDGLHILKYNLSGIDDDPPYKTELVLAQAIAVEVTSRGWTSVLRSIEIRSPEEDSNHPLYGWRSRNLVMLAYGLKDLLRSANIDRIQKYSELEISRRVPYAIRNLYRGTNLSGLVEYARRWREDVDAVGMSIASNDSAPPCLIADVSFDAIGVRARQLLTQETLLEEGRLMKNCVGELWPLVASCSGVVFSLTDDRRMECASVVYRLRADNSWTITCGGPNNEPPTRELRAAAHQLRTCLMAAMQAQPQPVQYEFSAASARMARHEPGGSLYTELSEVTAAEFLSMRRWFPCGALDPVARLRAVWPS